MRLTYHFIQQQEPDFPVRLLCNTLEVSKSSYYQYRAQASFQPSQADQQMSNQIQSVFWENRRRYGSRRIQKALQAQDIDVGRHQIRRLMQLQELRAIQPRSFVPRTTDSRHGLRACPNLLLGLGQPTRPDQAWVSDITYLPLAGGGWAYLASWLDLFSRRIIGWCVDITMEESLIIRSFDQATTLRRPHPGLIAHSDQGGQYFGKTFRDRLIKWQCRQSMAEKDNPYQNAHAESLWSRLKAELLEDGCFENLQDAHDELFNYIEGYYNIRRLHSSLGYLSPINFEQQYHQANFDHNSQSQVSG
jgi:transposase InsO family protein